MRSTCAQSEPAQASQGICLFSGVALLGGHEVGERWNLFKPLPGCQVDLRAGHGVTPGEARGVGYRAPGADS